VKYTTDRPFADPEKAARKVIEIASTVEPAQGRAHHIEKSTNLSFGARPSMA
jgi:hypothetical protein